MKRVLLLMCLSVMVVFAYAQRTISGKVVAEADGTGVPGVNVIIKGTTIGTTTDLDGNYRLSVEDGQDALVFSFIGLATQEVSIGSRSVVDVSMSEDVETLEEVVVTALGVSREKASLGYAVQEVGEEALKAANTGSFLDALNGKVAGVQIQNSGGQPGAGTSMVIRGYTNISGSNQPLMVIDGVPVNNEVYTSQQNNLASISQSTPSANRAIDLNPDDIASVSVLKGGPATALYGIRAANGALIITTKSGNKNSGVRLSYDFSYTVDEVNKLPELTHAYARGRNGEYSNLTHWNWGPAYAANPVFPDGTNTDLDGDGIDEDVSGQAIPLNRDNFSRFWDQGSTSKHNISLTGGGENSSFYASIGRNDQQGIVPNSDWHRTSALFNFTNQLTNKFRVQTKLNYVNSYGTKFQQARGVMQGLGYWHHMWDIDMPHKTPAGDPTWFSTAVTSPRWAVEEEGEENKVNRFIGAVSLDYELADWLKATYRVGVDTYADDRKQVRPIGSVQTPGDAGDITEVRINSTDINSDFILSGNVDASSDINISYLVGNNIFKTQYDRLWLQGTSLSLKGFDDITNAANLVTSNSDGGKLLIGAYADVTVGYKNMLYVGLTGRNDWSSTLPADNNNFFYPSANVGFVFSELINSRAIGFGKVRVSYAKNASDAPEQSIVTVYESYPGSTNQATNQPTVGGFPRFTLDDTQNNPTLKPVQTSEVELGLEMSFFDNLIGLDAAIYNKTSTDQIIRVPMSRTAGFDEYFANLGEVNNKGVEISLNINNPVKVAGFDWNMGFNFTKNVGEVVRISDDLDRVILANGWWSNVQLIAEEGQPFGALYGLTWQRYDADPNDDVEPTLDDPIVIGTDGLPIASNQREIVGNINPDWILGFNNSMSYKGVLFNFTLERKQGGDIVNGTRSYLVYSGTHIDTEERFYDAADPNGNATRVFEGVQADGTPNTVEGQLTNGYWHNSILNVDEGSVEDASWWRLRSLSVGYSLPNSILGNGPFKNLTVMFIGRNLWLNTPYTGIDPETSALGPLNFQGFDELQVPNSKSYGVSLSAKF